MATDSLRAAIINEVEESFNQAQDQNKLSLRMEALSSWVNGNEDDFYVSSEAVEQCKMYGLDSRYSFLKNSALPSAEKKNVRGVVPDESMLEECLESFLSLFVCDDDTDNLTFKERVLALKLHQKTYEPLLLHLKETRPAFCRALQQHSLLTGKFHSSKRKQFRRKKEKKSPDRDTKEAYAGSDQSSTAPIVLENSSSAEIAKNKIDASVEQASWEHYRHVLALVVTKAVCSGSLQSLLIAMSLLFHVMTEEKEQKRHRFIPVGDVLSALFERKTPLIKASGHAVTVPNPFRRCALNNNKLNCVSKSRTMSESVSRLGDVCSVGTSDEVPAGGSQAARPSSSGFGLGEDSKFMFGVHSDAGSIVGSAVGSLMAEKDTDTTSIGGGDALMEHLDIISEDATEDELLAQALALSLGGCIPGGGASAVSVSLNMGERPTNSPTLSESTARESVKHWCAEINYEKLAEIYPMSTYGPFCSEEFWSHCLIAESFTIENLGSIKSNETFSISPVDVPIENVIIALMSYIRGGLDVMFNEESAPWMDGASRKTEKGCRSDLLVASSLEVVPLQAMHFSLVENLLDMTLHVLSNKNESKPADGTMPSIIRNNQERVEHEISWSKWKFEKYFLVWMSNSLLNVLRANFRMLAISGTSPSAVSLDLRRSPAFSAPGSLSSPYPTGSATDASYSGSASSYPLVCRILKIVVECVGGNHFPNSCSSGRIDLCLGSSSAIPAVLPTCDDENTPPLQSPLWIACDAEYRHSITISGIEAFVQGYCIFFSSYSVRENVFYSLMHNSSPPGHLDLGHFYLDSPFFTFKRYCESIAPERIQELMPLYYRVFLFQKLCIHVSSIRMKPFFPFSVVYADRLSHSADVTQKKCSVFDDANFNPGGTGEGSRANYIGFWPSPLEKDKLENDSEEKNSINIAKAMPRLYNCILSRLGKPDIMEEYLLRYKRLGRIGTNSCDDRFFGPMSCMFWGEFGLLETIQSCFIENMVNPPLEAESTQAFTFDSARCSRNISISASRCSITQQKNKEWSTVAAAEGFAPNSGLHIWSIHMGQCSKGNVFIGVVTADASTNNYVGSDKHGWGFIGTPSLWHDHTKIRSDYGVKIVPGSVVHVTLDTDKKTLSYIISGTNWGVAFDGLPNKILYPAVSLYQSGDTASISLRGNQSVPALEWEGRYEMDSWLGNPIRIVNFFLVLFSHLDEIIHTALRPETSESGHYALSHPFIVTLFPQLTAALVNWTSGSNRWYSYVSLNFLPHLTRLTKMLAAATEIYPHDDIYERTEPLISGAIINDVCGEWKLESSATGDLPAQTYYISLISNAYLSLSSKMPSAAKTPNLDPEMDSGSPSRLRNRTYADSVHFSGIGSSGVFPLKVIGTIIGTRIKFLETWVGSGTCTVDARLSLDGATFSGFFTTSNHTGKIQGTRMFNQLSHYKRYTTQMTALKSALIGVMACGSLSCKLIVGIEPSLAFADAPVDKMVEHKSASNRALIRDSIDDTSEQLRPGVGINRSASASAEEFFTDLIHDIGQRYGADDDYSCEEDEDFENEHDEFEREEKLDDSADSVKDGTQNAFISGSIGVEANNDTTNTAFNSKQAAWLSSSLFSSGLHLDSVVIGALKDEIFVYMKDISELEVPPVRKKIRLESCGISADFVSKSKRIQDDWAAKVFSYIDSCADSSGVNCGVTLSADPELLVGSPGTIPTFCQHLMDAKSGNISSSSSGPLAAYQLDQYVIHHTGMAALSRMGGDALQNARRAVLAALIKHCGCSNYCERVATDIISGTKSIEERPSPLLIQVWTSGQRIIEDAVRKKQQSGVSYGFVGQELCTKSMILFTIQPQAISVEVSEILSLSNFDVEDQNVLNTIQDSISKILFDAVDFLHSSVAELNGMKSALVRATLRGLSRTAGFRSLSFLFSKFEDKHWFSGERIPAITNPFLQSAALKYVVVGIHACSNINELSNTLKMITGVRKPATIKLGTPVSLPPAQADISESGSAIVSEGTVGYYGDGLSGCSIDVFQELRSSIESIYDFITQFLQRCTWASDKNGQCTSLACWNTHVQPEDHQFLNRCGIFKVLQTVLNDTRETSRDGTVANSVFTLAGLSDEDRAFCEHNVKSAKALSVKLLSRLAMLTVHSLASQVAFSKEIRKIDSPIGRPLQRQPSGPETLSQALFDMLFSELFCCFKELIDRTKENSTALLSSFDWTVSRENVKLFSNISQVGRNCPAVSKLGQICDDGGGEFSLHGEEYIYRILRLLFSVSGSAVCRRYLTSAKWLTLLFSGIGYGGYGIQRRLLRLLRRLLSATDVSNLDCYVPKIFCFGGNDLLEPLSAFDDEDSRMLLAEDCGPEISFRATFAVECAKKISQLLLDGVAAIIPNVAPSPFISFATALEAGTKDGNSDGMITHESDVLAERNYAYQFLGLLHIFGTNSLLSAESIFLLRSLMNSVSWSSVVGSVLEKPLLIWRKASENMATSNDNTCNVDLLRQICAVMGVIGGFPDRIREGGVVALKPMAVIPNGAADSLALRLSSVSHSCGLVVEKSKAGGVDVILIEPAGDKQHASNTDESSPPQGFVFAGANPVKTVRISANDVTPLSEIQPVIKNLGVTFIENFIFFIKTKCLPETNRHISRDSESAVGKEKAGCKSKRSIQQEMTEIFVNTNALRAMSKCGENDEVSEMILTSNPDFFLDVLSLSMTESLSGGLAVIEKVESRWSMLRDALVTKEFEIIDPKHVSSNSNRSEESCDSTHQCSAELVTNEEATRTEERPERNRESDANSPSFSSTGLSLLSAMRFGQQSGSSPPDRVEGVLGGLFGLGGRVRAVAAHGLGGGSGDISESAKQQMIEMGFRSDWCDAALRRSRNNVEIAINLCFEHGDDMDRLVEEDAAMLLHQQRASTRSTGPRGPRPSPFPPNLARRPVGDNSSSPSLREDTEEVLVDPEAVRHMSNLGFPTNWCIRALTASRNDPEAALTWILSHADDLLIEFPGVSGAFCGIGGLSDRGQVRRVRREGLERTSPSDFPAHSLPSAGDLNESDGNRDPQVSSSSTAIFDEPESPMYEITPLTVMSGRGSFSDNYTCSANGDGSFPTIGCRGYGVTSGKWYFEALILTSGCIQIGWVDCGYIGLSENGQGVGDCLNSWCFDGWRVMLWHEVAAEWGAKWAPGNVLGCAIDMDERKMIFSLNGETTAIGMGAAFEGFRCAGGMYPACSISQGQQIRLRFGAKGFKYVPPDGYRPFSEHILHVNCLRSTNRPQKSISSNSLSNVYSSALCEGTIEEQLGGAECSWQHRYFPIEESQRNVSSQYPEPSLPRSAASTPEDILDQFKALSMDLCILYSRLTVLNILEASSRYKSSDEFLKLVVTGSVKDRGYSALEALLKLIRLSSITSNRTRMYLQTVSLLSRGAPRPQNLGSIFSIGGMPLVGILFESLGTILAKSRLICNHDVIVTVLIQLQNEISRSTQRAECTKWKSGAGLVPSVLKTGPLPDSLCSTIPSLGLAVGLTIMLIHQFSNEVTEKLPSACSSTVPKFDDVLHSVEEMCRHWCLGLQSPNITVKLCCIKMLNALFQEFVVVSSSCPSAVHAGFICRLCDIIPVKRLQNLALNRIKQERGFLPICSEFLQALLELVNSVSTTEGQMRNILSDLSGDFSQVSSVDDESSVCDYISKSSIENDNDSIDFHWDAMQGTLVSDDSWDIWTGKIRQLPSDGPRKLVNSTSVADRNGRDRPQRQPPELLVGCKVARKKKVMHIVEGVEEANAGVEKSGGQNFGRQNQNRPSASNSQPTRVAPAGGSLSPGSRNDPRRAAAGLQSLMDLMERDGEDSSSPDSRSTFHGIRQRIAELQSRPGYEVSDNTSAPNSGWRTGFLSRQGSEPNEAPTPKSSVHDFEWEIGTVITIVSHPDVGSLPGSARVVRWDGNNHTASCQDSTTSNEENGAASKVTDAEILTETVSWGHNGVYDVVHVILNSDGSINQKYPIPKTNFSRSLENGFGSDQTFGVILRIRKARSLPSDKEEGIRERFDGVMEFCDFSASVYVTGTKWDDGAWTLTEEKLLTGPSHSSWSVRFGHAHWRSGITYDLEISKSTRSDKYDQILTGQFSVPIHLTEGLKKPNFIITGDISLQKANLFHFDEKLHSQAISLSLDKLSAFSDGKESRSTVFGNIGFTHGVHYWEFKVEQGDIGNIFVGVAEKPFIPGQPNNLRLNRWLGSGFVNIRTSFKHTPSGTADRVYGDHFHTGDTVGVLLDMDRGRLSFFLDGLKYGEHSLTDLGEAFDGLTTGNSHQKALFPIVGMRRNLDRVTITSRWLCSYGPDAKGILDTVCRAAGLLDSWNMERPAIKPLARDMWIYREAWREHHRWIHNPVDRIRTRCKAPLLYVGASGDPSSCAEASIRLGLPMALFRGDRITFKRSGGRILENGEEAVILGAYRGLLWYRLDTQRGVDSRQSVGSEESAPFVLEGSSLAWQLCAQDVEGLVLSRRAGHVDPRIAQLKLPRIPKYAGARLLVEFKNGAIMRDGIEIDSSEVVGTVDLGATVTAFERRHNSSNILRFRVSFNGKIGWISERIRGGSEEHMVSEVTQEPAEVVEKAKLDAREVLKAYRLAFGGAEDPSETPWLDVTTLDEAMQCWERSVCNLVGDVAGLSFLRKNAGTEKVHTLTFEKFVEEAATMDGAMQWPVEADMQLAELISRIASREGVSPLNVTSQKLKDVVRCLDPANNTTSLLMRVNTEKIIARAAVLRVANIIFGYSLPYIDLKCPEEKLQTDLFGRQEDVQVTRGSGLKVELGDCKLITSWQPPCAARKLRSLRRLLFSQTKSTFFESVLDMTMTPTPLPQDEYEEPREIKTIKVNRVMATSAKLSMIKNNSERLRVSVFGQIYKEMRSWPVSSYRRSYVGKGHGGQKRAFKVKFLGEGVNDYGGPYRAVFEQIVDEIQCDATPVAGQKPWEKTLLTLLVPCPNRASGTGINQDKFMFIPSIPSPTQQELMQFLGRLTGMAVRHNLTVGIDFSSLVWRPLVRLPISRAHLGTVDSHIVTRLERMEKVGEFLEKKLCASFDHAVAETSDSEQFSDLELPNNLDSSFVPTEWEDLNFSVYLCDGYTRVPLVPNGEKLPVNAGNWKEYIRLVEDFRLREGSTMLRLFKDGLSTVLPVELLPLFTGPELELMISGTRKVDTELLRKCTEYENLEPDSELISNFWSVLQEMNDDEKTSFLRFVWARSRMPATAQDFPMNFKLQAASTSDEFLPHAQTCFFSLSLPAYSTKEILKEKLLYAINNSPNMDADVRLHNADGWADL